MIQYNIPQMIKVPNWLGRKEVGTYFLALVLVTIVYFRYILPWTYLLFGIISILAFFFGASKLYNKWTNQYVVKSTNFERNLLIGAFVIRLAWTLFIYFIFQKWYGDSFGFENLDASGYNDTGVIFSEAIRNKNFIETWNNFRTYTDLSDMGYAVYMGLIYSFTNDSILFFRVLKCVWSSLTVVLMYRLAQRNFGENVGKLTAAFCLLWPNFWYYCGAHLKEVEMVFLSVLFVNQADQMIKQRSFSAWKLIPTLLIAASLLTIRTPLALIAMLSLLFAIFMSSTRIVSWGKRIIIGGLAVLLIGLTMGNRIQEEAKGLFEKVQSNEQAENMKWRSERENGNKFAKYASSTVFAPLIFTIPFPTMTNPFEGQDAQKLLNGGNFCKNIISFFTILALFSLLLTGRWRNHLLPLSFLLGYLVVLAMSVFAQSERFHQPAMPFELMFAAYGVLLVVQGLPIHKGVGSLSKYKSWFGIWCFAMIMAALMWNWFKIAGRGLA